MPQTPNTLEFRNKLDLFFGIGVQFIITMFVIRLIAIASLRMVYPFIPQISAGLGLTAVGFSWLIFVRSMIGLTGPFFGLLADQQGRRKTMAFGLLAQSIGLVCLAFSRQWWTLGAIILLGIGATAFLPVQLAYISDLVAYEKRGRAMATIDVSFAITGIVILPIVGWLIDAVGWRAPFLILSIPSLIAAAVIWFRFPTTEHHLHTGLPWSAIVGVAVKPNVLASTAVGILVFFASSSSVTIWGVWFSTDFGLDAADLGLVATTLSFAELGGIVLSALFIDRIGKRRGSQIGLALTATAFLLLPFTQFALLAAILILIGLSGVLEFTTISLFSLFSEQTPQTRAMTISLVSMGIAAGMGLGSPISITLWEHLGLWAVSVVSTTCLLLAFILVGRFLTETSNPRLRTTLPETVPS